jgi:hypothetical protein
LILAVEGISNFVSCFGWYYSFERKSRPPFLKLLLIIYASLSVSGALPTGQGGEIAKANMIRGHADSKEILSSLLIYNYLHIFTTFILVLAGAAAAFFSPDFTPEVSVIVFAICSVLFLFTFLAGLLLYRKALSRFLEWLKGLRVRFLHPSDKILAYFRDVDAKLHDIRAAEILRISFWLTAGRLWAVIEIYIILYYLNISKSVFVSLMVYSTTAVANYILMVLPAREGFLEGSTFVIFKFIGMNGADGLALEIVRRLRKIAYQIFGLVIMLFLIRRKEDVK